jgi:alpha-mannosidase/mannosylglycerate hydrolase
MAGRTLHVVSHSHWDREWYLPFELHRRRLVKLLDDLLDVMDADPEFGSFHLDGQAIVLEDYLAIRPAARERLRAAATAGRLTVGPWYVLQDEFLTSAEAQVRNMLYGRRTAAAFGPPLKVGYLADAFGHIGQMPAILAGFGIDSAVFGRGLRPLDAAAPPDEHGCPSEVCWQSPDGSSVLGVWMVNWYNNAMDIPADEAACVARFEAIRAACLRFATTSHLLLMNGCDHTPCQLNISRLIATARRHLDDEIIHSRLDDYCAAVAAEAGDLPLVRGELRSEQTDGWGTLTNVLSSRLYLKQANWRCQKALERYLEPLEAVGALHGDRPDRDFRAYLWKSLLANHPHDSICGCSADPVHREMEIRFDKVEQLANQLGQERLAALAERLDTSPLPAEAVAVMVYNPLAFERRETVEATVSFPDGTELAGVTVRDATGAPVEIESTDDLGRVWDYTLPDDRFRETYHCRRLVVRFAARVPAFGYAVYAVAPSLEAPAQPPPAQVLENEFLRVTPRPHGAFDLLDKRAGRLWRGLNVLTFGPDSGDEYIFRAPEGAAEQPLGGGQREDAPFWQVEPGGQAAEGYDFWVTEAEDEDEPQVLGVALRLTLAGERLDVTARLHNDSATGYRVRALFPTDRQTETAAADGHFEVVDRAIAVWRGWRNPSNCQPCQDFVDVSDATAGLTLANRGLPEYEILRDGRNTLALTLLRGTDRIGDWGDFPTPDAQCQGDNLAEYSLIPHAGPLAGSGADLAARAYNAPLLALATGRHDGSLPLTASWLALEPAELVLSAVRWAEDREGFLVRFYNSHAQPVEATLRIGLPVRHAWRCNLDEQRLADLGAVDGELRLAVGGKQIVTIELGG